MKPVICTFCNAEIYTYTGPEPPAQLKAEYFAPRGSYPAPERGGDLKCPRCFTPWVSFSDQVGQLRMLVDWSYTGSGAVGKNKGGEA